jgi:hypothetical protein
MPPGGDGTEGVPARGRTQSNARVQLPGLAGAAGSSPALPRGAVGASGSLQSDQPAVSTPGMLQGLPSAHRVDSSLTEAQCQANAAVEMPALRALAPKDLPGGVLHAPPSPRRVPCTVFGAPLPLLNNVGDMPGNLPAQEGAERRAVHAARHSVAGVTSCSANPRGNVGSGSAPFRRDFHAQARCPECTRTTVSASTSSLPMIVRRCAAAPADTGDSITSAATVAESPAGGPQSLAWRCTGSATSTQAAHLWSRYEAQWAPVGLVREHAVAAARVPVSAHGFRGRAYGSTQGAGARLHHGSTRGRQPGPVRNEQRVESEQGLTGRGALDLADGHKSDYVGGFVRDVRGSRQPAPQQAPVAFQGVTGAGGSIPVAQRDVDAQVVGDSRVLAPASAAGSDTLTIGQKMCAQNGQNVAGTPLALDQSRDPIWPKLDVTVLDPASVSAAMVAARPPAPLSGACALDSTNTALEGGILLQGAPVPDAEAVVLVEGLVRHSATLAVRGAMLTHRGRLAEVLLRHRELVASPRLHATGGPFAPAGWAVGGADRIVQAAVCGDMRASCAAISDEIVRAGMLTAVTQMESSAMEDSEAVGTAAALQERTNTLLALGYTLVLGACSGGAHVQSLPVASAAFLVRA